ncbi:MAG: hypothetical protein HRT73_12950, partial [Flavobacteriales bacterium]|nr:hypothetical protein [Flavobacteriales bacterium]
SVVIDGVHYCNDPSIICDDCNQDFQGVEFDDPSINLNNAVYDFSNNFFIEKFGNRVKASFNGNIIWGKLVGLECLNECMDGVLHASSAKFKQEWDIDYYDAEVSVNTGTFNRTRYGADNIWRLHETYLFDIDRKQSALNNNVGETQTGVDGTYNSFVLFNWSDFSDNKTWTKTNTINRYSPYGFELENEDALGIKSSALYGYKNSVVTAVASNTGYEELAFDGFEDYYGSYATSGKNNGHIPFLSSNGTAQLSSVESHTGKYSIALNANDVLSFPMVIPMSLSNSFTPKAGEAYYFSAWVKSDDVVTLNITVNSVTTTITTSITDQKIEGWQRIEGKFKMTPTIAGNNSITITAGGQPAYLDDVRIQPFVSSIKTYVYDPNTLWLKAELDDRNYATFYNYDEEGNLVQIKKETKDGLRTIVSNRKNVKRNE